LPRSFQFKRGPENRLPVLRNGEPVFTTDTKKLIIGSDDGITDIDSIEVNEYGLVPIGEINQIHTDAASVSSYAQSAKSSSDTAVAAALSLTSALSKLNTIEEGAQANVQADWEATEGPAAILNKPTNEFEAALGNPAADDYILTSKADGTRAWAQNSLQDAEGFFDIDVDGGLEPSLNPTVSSQYELDSNGDIMPKAVT
jgi:hypothetical protein